MPFPGLSVLKPSPWPLFQTHAATDNEDAGRLNRRKITGEEEGDNLVPTEESPLLGGLEGAHRPYDPATDESQPEPRRHSFTKKLLHLSEDAHNHSNSEARQPSPKITHLTSMSRETNQPLSLQPNGSDKKSEGHAPKPGLGPRPIGGTEKLGTFSGVFVPTCLNVLSILMFLRFGFILGQGGVLGMMGMLVVAYIINLITTFSLSAIASNGTVRGGGAYYLISRSLGPEFGGSIGVVFYLGFVFNTGLNAVGLIDCVKQNFGSESGNWYQILPEGIWYEYAWATIVLLLCTCICLAGSAIFARASTGLLVILLVATFSIPFSALVMSPWVDRDAGIEYTGPSLATFKGNLIPKLTRGAAGSQLDGRETFQDLFGILFPATGGIFAGASMSGDLKHPSKAIPKGTLWGLGLTFVAYSMVILAMAATITRASFINNVNVIQDTNISGILVLAGEFASTFFSTLMGVIGSAKLLQALARDKLLPGFTVFGQGTAKGDEPIYAIFFTYVIAQITMLADINQIASFVTMTYLMTFLVMNLATFLLKIGSAPNFRPSFHFFSWETALAGTVISGAAMFFVDGVYASACVALLIMLFLLIHYTTPPKSWGDVSQSLIYHQVRKYLLRLRQEHVKFWRPQILLLVNDPRRQYKLIQFCNSMKKGGLYVLGHVIVSQDFGGSVPEARRQQAAWTKYIDFSKVKAFVSIAISPGLEWGVRNIVLSTGLGGMRPNIAVMGFLNMDDLRKSKPSIDVPELPLPSKVPKSTSKRPKIPREDSRGPKPDEVLPTDTNKTEGVVGVTSYVTALEDLLLRVQINVAVAKGFQELEFPHKEEEENSKRYIDLWPIQMSAEVASEGEDKANVLTTNFDTYTLILQLGCILNTVPAWKRAYELRVAVFVEYESDVEEERGRVKALLENLRIEAEVLVFWLASGDLPTYEVIVNGQSPGLDAEQEVDECLKDQEWWDEIQRVRGKRDGAEDVEQDLADVASIFTNASAWPDATYQQGPRNERWKRFMGLRRLMKKSKRRQTMSGLSKLGVSLNMRTQNLHPNVMGEHPSNLSASEESGSESESDSDAMQSDADQRSIVSAASEGDLSDYESDSEPEVRSPQKIARRRSHGDSMRGPPVSKRATGEREPKVPAAIMRPHTPALVVDDLVDTAAPSTPVKGSRPDTASSNVVSVSNLTNSIYAARGGSQNKPLEASSPSPNVTPQKLEERFTALRQKPPQPIPSPIPTPLTEQPPNKSRPTMSRHASMRKFSSKPVPMTKVATEDGPGPSIMFTDTPSPPPRRHRLPSAYKARESNTDLTVRPDYIAEGDEEPYERTGSGSPRPSSHRGSTYSTQSIPLSFNDLPCRAQHLILNELIRNQSSETAVMFTTLPSPVVGTGESEEASVAYLSDLEVLCKGCPPVLLVHSNSMTVTMSL